MKRVDDFRLRFGRRELVPIMVGGMGVDISTAELALEAARLGGIALEDVGAPARGGLEQARDVDHHVADEHRLAHRALEPARPARDHRAVHGLDQMPDQPRRHALVIQHRPGAGGRLRGPGARRGPLPGQTPDALRIRKIALNTFPSGSKLSLVAGRKPIKTPRQVIILMLEFSARFNT